jgi:hypothetical protein
VEAELQVYGLRVTGEEVDRAVEQALGAGIVGHRFCPEQERQKVEGGVPSRDPQPGPLLEGEPGALLDGDPFSAQGGPRPDEEVDAEGAAVRRREVDRVRYLAALSIPVPSQQVVPCFGV